MREALYQLRQIFIEARNAGLDAHFIYRYNPQRAYVDVRVGANWAPIYTWESWLALKHTLDHRLPSEVLCDPPAYDVVAEAKAARLATRLKIRGR